MRNITFINGVEGVIPSGVATVNIPIDRRYHGLKLFVNGTAAAVASDVVSRVRIFVNGQIMRDLTATQAQKIFQLNGQTFDPLEIPLAFSEPWRASVLGEEATSWDLFGVAKCTLEVTFTAEAAPTLQVQGAYDYAKNVTGDGKSFLAIVKQLQQVYTNPVGTLDIVNIPTSNPIQRILMQTSAGTISSLEVYRASEKIHEGPVAQNTRWLADHKLDGTAFTFPIVFDYEQQVSSPLLVQNQGDLLVRPVFTNAGSVNVLAESRSQGYF